MEIIPKKYIIFSFDGGGARMILQYRILQRVLEKFPNLLDKVSLFAGTSAGAILAAGLATDIIGPKSQMGEMINKVNLEKIFGSNTFCRKVKGVNGLRLSKYTNSNLKKLLNTYFGSIRLKNLQRGVFIPSFCVNPKEEGHELPILAAAPSWTNVRVKRWHPVYYTTLGNDFDKLIAQAVLESTAAPTYFPIDDYHVDGGIGNNNPCLSALTSVLTTGVDIKDIYILSFGSGEIANVFETSKNAELGAIQWLPKIITMLFDADQEVTSRNTYQILGDNFWRIQPILNEQVDLDDVSKYDNLVKIANDFDLTHTFEWLEKL